MGPVTDTDAASNTIAENAAAGTVAGITALATDADVTDTVGYSVDDARFTIDAGGVVRVASGATFEALNDFGQRDANVIVILNDNCFTHDCFPH